MPIEFDATDDLITCPGSSSLASLNLAAWSFSCWCRPDSAGEADEGMFFRKNDSGGIVAIEFRFDDSATGILRLQRGRVGGAALVIATTTTVPNSVWSNIVVASPLSTTATNHKIYLNGVEVTYTTQQDGAGSSWRDDASESLAIGNHLSATNTFDGQLAEFAFFPGVTLTATQAALIYAAGLKSRIPSQIGGCSTYYPLDDFQDSATVTGASSIKDRIGTLHGTPSNSPTGRGGFPW